MHPILQLIIWTFVPGLELRASIPWGFFNGDVSAALGIPAVVAICLAANILVGIIAFALMRPCETILRKWGWFDRKVWPFFERKREKLRPLVEKYGVWGVSVFIGVPLPGTGAYTGAVGAYLLNLDRKRFMLANVIGVLIACIAVTAICLLIQHGVVGEDSLVRRLLIKNID